MADDITLTVVPADEQHSEPTIQLCVLASSPNYTKQPVEYGSCADCGIAIRYAMSGASQPAVIKRVCPDCIDKYDAGEVVMTEQTMKEVLEHLHLPDTVETRRLVIQLATEAIKVKRREARERRSETEDSAWE